MQPNFPAAITLSDHLLEALAALNRARKLVKGAPHPEAVVMEVTQAELSIARVIGLIAGSPEG